MLYHLKSNIDELEKDFIKEGFSARKQSSIKMRVQNAQYIDTNKGLANYAQQTKEVYDRLVK